MFRQTSGVFIGTSPDPELANNFGFWHEFEFQSPMVNKSGPINSRHPSECINQFTTTNRTKRYIDDIFTVSLVEHTSGLSLKDVISQEGTFNGMCPTTVLDVDDSNVM